MFQLSLWDGNLLESLLSSIDVEAVKNFLGEAASKQFSQTLLIFLAASYVHGRQVRKEIKTQLGQLVTVMQADLEATRTMLGSLASRVDKLESYFKLKEEK